MPYNENYTESSGATLSLKSGFKLISSSKFVEGLKSLRKTKAEEQSIKHPLFRTKYVSDNLRRPQTRGLVRKEKGIG